MRVIVNRPVSLTVHACKLWESILRDNISVHLRDFNLIKRSPYSFVKNRSCLTNVLEFLKYVYNYIDKGLPVDVIYFDFRKAFDKIPHKRLMVRVKACGRGGKIWGCIEDWLSGRKQRVTLNGRGSNWIDVLSGVPQESVLGPVLFVIYINDIDSYVSSKILKFSDDTKIVGVVLVVQKALSSLGRI